MRPARLLVTAVLAVGVGYVLVLLGAMACRVAWPFEIEWMEGGELAHAVRLHQGLPLYGPPSADFTPFFYTPLYPAVVEGLSRLGLPLGFALGRAVSSAATLATMGMLYAIVAREAGRPWGLLAACLYAAMFRFCGAFFDLARVDALAAALGLGSAWVASRATRPRDALLAAAIVVAAYFTKQTESVLGPAIALGLAMRSLRLALIFAGSAAASAVALVLAFDATSDGWFWFYIFEGHQGHALLVRNLLLEYWRDVLFLAPVLLLFPTLALSYSRATRPLALALTGLLVVAFVQRAATLDYPEHMYYRELWYESPRWLLLVPPLLVAGLLGAARGLRRTFFAVPGYWLVMAGAGALASALNHSTQWSYSNCFIPIAVFATPAVVLTLHRLTRGDGVAGALAALAMLVQLVALAYDPRAQVPSAADRDALTHLKKRVARLEAPLLVPAHPMLTYEATGMIHFHEMSTGDVSFHSGIPDLRPRIERGAWNTILLDEHTSLGKLEPWFYLSDRYSYRDGELDSRTGFVVRPFEVWRRQDRAERELAPGITGDFEAGAFTGWTAEGAAFGDRPARRAELGGLDGIQGDRAASSRSSAGAGSLTTVPFTVDAPRITFLVAGKLGGYVRALVGEDEVARVQPIDANVMQPRSLELDATVGRVIRLQIVDEITPSAAGDPHPGIVVDDFHVTW
jgi:hypothetical protein